MKKILFSFFSAVILFAAGCSTSKIITSWNANSSVADSAKISLPLHFKKIMVVGLFTDNNRALRQQLEDQLVQHLSASSFSAVSSVSEYGPQSFVNAGDSEALAKITHKDVDGVITIGLIDQNQQANYVPRPRYYNPVGGWVYHPMWGAWGYRPYGGFGGGGRRYYQDNSSFTFETNLYLFRNKQLIYSTQSQSDASEAGESMAKDYSKSILKDMLENNIIR